MIAGTDSEVINHEGGWYAEDPRMHLPYTRAGVGSQAAEVRCGG